MKKKITNQSQPPDFVSVTALKTIQWNYNDSREFIKGEVYSLPKTVYNILAKYFVINEDKQPEEIKDGE